MTFFKPERVSSSAYHKGNVRGLAVNFENTSETPYKVGDWLPVTSIEPSEVLGLLYLTTSAALASGVLKFALVNADTEEVLLDGIFQDEATTAVLANKALAPKSGVLLHNKAMRDALRGQTGWSDSKFNLCWLYVQLTGAASVPADFAIRFLGLLTGN